MSVAVLRVYMGGMSVRVSIDRVIETDVLVVGGGAAALRAGIAAADAGAQTIIAAKGALGKSGATTARVPASAWQAVDGCSGPDDSPETHYQDIMAAAMGMADARLAWIIAHESAERLSEMERWGLNLFPDPSGRQPHYSGYSCFASQPRAHGMPGSDEGGHTGNMMSTLAREFTKRGVTLHEHTTVIDLLVQSGACVGAMAINPDGAFVIYRAGAVILATGGAAQMFPVNLFPMEITGDGHAMAFRAGAELVNMEFMQLMIQTVAGRPPQLGGSIWAAMPVVRNALGEDVLPRYLPTGVTVEQVMWDRTFHTPFSSRDVSRYLDVAIAKEVLEGRGLPSYQMIVDFSQVNLSQIRRPRRLFSPPPAQMTLGDPRIKVAPGGHTINGGLRVDEWGQSTVTGLLAAGEVAAGSHGADRLGGGMISACSVFGARAGHRAAEYARAAGRPDLQPDVLDVAAQRLSGFGRSSDGDWTAIRKSLQSLCLRHLHVIRNEQGLRELADSAASLRREVLPKAPIQDARALVGVLETDGLLFVAELAARAALLRRESRGGHLREDYPNVDDARWNASLFWRKRDGEPVIFAGRYRQDVAEAVQVSDVT